MSKKRLLSLIGVMCIGLFLIEACYYDNEEELYPGNCDTSVANYQDAVLPIIESRCYACHSTSAAQGDIILEGYDALSEYVEDGRFLCSINWESGCSPMPQNQSQLSSCDLTIINTWVENGALDD